MFLKAAKYQLPEKVHHVFFYTALLVLITLAVIRSVQVPLTHDEANTLMREVAKKYMDIISGGGSNNHILNTVLIKFFTGILGDSVMVIRLPNVLAFVLYMFFCNKLLRAHTDPILSPFLFVVLCFNPLIFEFFTLARGYGLSFGFLAMSVYFFLNWIKNRERKYFIRCYLSIFLGMASSLMLMPVMCSFLLIYFIATFFDKNRSRKLFREIWPVIVLIAGTIAFCFEPIRKLVSAHELYFGGHMGFWKNTVCDTIFCMLYFAPNAINYEVYLQAFVVLVAVAGLVMSFLSVKQGRWRYPLPVMFSVLLSTSLIIISQCYIMKTPFPEKRTALFLFVLFLLLTVFVFNQLYTSSVKLFKVFSASFCAFLALTFLVHFIFNENLYISKEWKYDMDTPGLLEKVNTYENKLKPVRLYMDWKFMPAAKYYVGQKKYKNIRLMDSGSSDGAVDFYYVEKQEAEQLVSSGKKVLIYFSKSGNFLLQ